MNADLIRFLSLIGPDLIELGGDMFELFEGSANDARREIADRRADIAARRKANDAALEDKYKSG